MRGSGRTGEEGGRGDRKSRPPYGQMGEDGREEAGNAERNGAASHLSLAGLESVPLLWPWLFCHPKRVS